MRFPRAWLLLLACGAVCAARPAGAVVADCSGSATLDVRTVENPAAGPGMDVAAWDVRVPACAGVLVYQIVDADTGTPLDRDAVFPPHTVRHERWEKRDGGALRLHLQLQNLDVPRTCGNCTRKLERWQRRVRAVVRWFPRSGRA